MLFRSPPLVEGREKIDLENSKKIIEILDEEKEIYENELLKMQNDPIFQLDLQILYLRRVHGLCYYSAEEYDDERMLSSKCGPIYIRSPIRISPSKLGEYANTKTFQDQIDAFVKKRIAKGPIKIIKVLLLNNISLVKVMNI